MTDRARDDSPSPIMMRIMGGLADLPAVLFSRSAEPGSASHERLRRLAAVG